MTQIHAAKARRHRKITKGTREWADRNINCIDGCYNNCRYCYAKLMAKRFGRHTKDSWKEMKIRKGVLLKDFGKISGRVMFPSSHDIFEFEPFKEACLTVLESLLENGNEVLITTKPRPAVIREICFRFRSHKDQIQFRFTITSKDNRKLEFWEPNAPRFEERMTSLRFALQKGFKTSVSIEPFLDCDPTDLVHELLPSITESIWIGRMNYIPRKELSEEEKPHFNRVRKNCETAHLVEIRRKLSSLAKVRLKDSIINQISRVRM
ncbi:MAG: hypothetical protein NWE90_04890 [Candidatus Bathyarchaeota archaeon]|nr:hypothetical protein [Candidatus Bathyarchaeota archaeon]